MIDTPQSFAAALLRAAAEAVHETGQAVEKGANNIKRDAQRNVRRSAPVHNAGAASAINYDMDGLSAEIGYDKTLRGGSLGNLLEYGGGGDHSPPHRDLGRALDDEEPKFEAEILRIVGRLL